MSLVNLNGEYHECHTPEIYATKDGNVAMNLYGLEEDVVIRITLTNEAAMGVVGAMTQSVRKNNGE